MRKLSKYEKETIINWNEAENLASVYTFNASLKRRLAEFSRKYPLLCRLECSTPEGSVTYVLDKSRLSIRFIPPYSEERKAAASAYAKEHGFQFLGDALRILHLRDDTRQPVIGLLVQVSKICPEFSRQKQFIVLAGPVFLQKRLVHPAPPPNRAAFLRQLQIGDVVVSHQRVADAVLIDFLW